MDMYPDDYRGGTFYLLVPLYAAAVVAAVACDILYVECDDDWCVA